MPGHVGTGLTDGSWSETVSGAGGFGRSGGFKLGSLRSAVSLLASLASNPLGGTSNLERFTLGITGGGSGEEDEDDMEFFTSSEVSLLPDSFFSGPLRTVSSPSSVLRLLCSNSVALRREGDSEPDLDLDLSDSRLGEEEDDDDEDDRFCFSGCVFSFCLRITMKYILGILQWFTCINKYEHAAILNRIM